MSLTQPLVKFLNQEVFFGINVMILEIGDWSDAVFLGFHKCGRFGKVIFCVWGDWYIEDFEKVVFLERCSKSELNFE
jgi:hypothetical protein